MTSSTGAAANNHAANFSSPARVRAVHSNSNKRCLPEQIQIARVRMRRIEKPVARLSGSSPAVLNASNTALIELDRPLPRTNLLQPLFMQHRQEDKRPRRQQQQPEEPDVVEENQCGSNRGERNRDLRVSEQPLLPLVGRLRALQVRLVVRNTTPPDHPHLALSLPHSSQTPPLPLKTNAVEWD